MPPWQRSGPPAVSRASPTGRRGWLLTGALVTLLIGGLTLLQYVASVDFGIDRVLVADTTAFQIHPEYPGRMAASTALAFVLVGAALLTLLYAYAEEAARGIVGTVGLTLLALSVVTLLSYSTGVLSDLRFGAVTGVAIGSLIGFLAIGASLVTVAWAQATPALLPAWLPLAAGVATLCTTLVLTRAVTSQEEVSRPTPGAGDRPHGAGGDLLPSSSRCFRVTGAHFGIHRRPGPRPPRRVGRDDADPSCRTIPA